MKNPRKQEKQRWKMWYQVWQGATHKSKRGEDQEDNNYLTLFLVFLPRGPYEWRGNRRLFRTPVRQSAVGLNQFKETKSVKSRKQKTFFHVKTFEKHYVTFRHMFCF